MASAESAGQSAMHDLDDDSDPYVQASPGPARDSVPEEGATIYDFTQRSRERIKARWGKPIDEPLPEPAPEPGSPVRLADGLNQLHYWRDRPPSLRAVWTDMRQGGTDTYDEYGMLAAVTYWSIGAPCMAWVCVLRVAESPAYRPGRAAGTMLALILLWIALDVADLNPFSLSDFNPF